MQWICSLKMKGKKNKAFIVSPSLAWLGRSSVLSPSYRRPLKVPGRSSLPRTSGSSRQGPLKALESLDRTYVSLLALKENLFASRTYFISSLSSIKKSLTFPQSSYLTYLTIVLPPYLLS